MGKHYHRIAAVAPDSIAWELGLEPGDAIITINGCDIQDIFDYQYYMEDEFLQVEVLTKDGETCLLEIEKDEDEDLGIAFESSLMDDYHSCCNKCVFCFIDQMPPGMRETLYFKDDDSRLSFLQGNYITLTNMKEEDIDRLIYYHLSPINISVHATNPQLRCQLLHNRFAGDILDKIRRFYEAGIQMNSQVVLCRGLNDGAELDRTIRDLGDFLPYMQSLSVVPVGLTRYRDKLEKLEPFDAEDAGKVLDQILAWQQHFLKEKGTAFVHASDEWFILAGREIPEAAYYEGYGQLENGVGMVRLFIDQVRERLFELEEKRESFLLPPDPGTGESGRQRRVSIATAKLAYPTICSLAGEVMDRYPWLSVSVHCIRNDFFGEMITVSGLMTGQDIIAQLKDEDLGQVLFLPENVLRAGEEVLLDDLTLSDLAEAIGRPVEIIESEGKNFVDKLLNI